MAIARAAGPGHPPCCRASRASGVHRAVVAGVQTSQAGETAAVVIHVRDAGTRVRVEPTGGVARRAGGEGRAVLALVAARQTRLG